ncbi:MAG: DegT/DnrJ/EryC1/StrS aminotransferase family protein [Acidobacteriota bacterium]|nr:DegT/DnrJ/EryC1/StrS aminotransferase family protein [Blastocatellia bacterium]MDW8411964.1 DegT/DnrJ/EryC1/StrS aminotransferase family protein [Acidobacteriota bacterium]
MRVEFYRHNIGDEEKRQILKALDSIFLTTGEYVYEFERELANYLGVKRAIGVMSCTAALHLALLACGVGPGDEVITTPLTFVATPNAILHAGAEPIFVDVEPMTGNIDAALVERAITKRTKAILPVHLYGHMCDMKTLRQIADAHGLAIVEDAAHCLEGSRDGYRPGQLGDFAAFSFYATKSITCGEGGAIVTNSDEQAQLLRKLTLHGMNKSAAERYKGEFSHWDMELLGWKYNMSNVQAALLTPQLRRVDERLLRREQICRRYEEAFEDLAELSFPKVLPGTVSARHLFTIQVDPDLRDSLISRLRAEGIAVTVNYLPCHLMSYYRNRYGYREGNFPVAERIGAMTITLPLYSKLTDEEVEYIIGTVKKLVCSK